MACRLSSLTVLAVTLLLASSPALQAQANPSWANCKTDNLSNYNCASYYSGTVALTATLKTPNGTETRSITATVTAGRVTCRVKGPTDPAFDGSGLLAVEHANTANAGEYTIQVWCPEAPGGKASRDDAPAIDSYKREATNYGTLQGKDEHEHPDADAANGVTGTEAITWSLRR
jgi:hypothetical protein